MLTIGIVNDHPSIQDWKGSGRRKKLRVRRQTRLKQDSKVPQVSCTVKLLKSMGSIGMELFALDPEDYQRGLTELTGILPSLKNQIHPFQARNQLHISQCKCVCANILKRVCFEVRLIAHEYVYNYMISVFIQQT